MERTYALIAMFAALIAALGLIPKITLTPGVPITAQSLGIMLCGTVLGARRGTLAVVLFLLLTALGLPLLAGGRGGLGVFVSPSAGFLIGFPLAALTAGLAMNYLPVSHLAIRAFLAAWLGAVLVLYLPGIVGMAITLDKSLAQASALAMPFLPGDTLKAIAAGLTTATIARLRPGIMGTPP